MSEQLVTNRPTRRDFVLVNRAQFDHIFTDSAVAKGDEIAKNLATLKNDIAPACDKTFVMMKNKQVWFDRNNSALYPKFEHMLPVVGGNYLNVVNYSLDFEGFQFVTMTFEECTKSFTMGKGNPYLQSDGNFKYFTNHNDQILTNRTSGDTYYGCCSNGVKDGWRDANITLVPIHRLRGKNAAAMSYPEAVLSWIANVLIPEGLTDKQEKFYKSFLNDYPKIEEYITADNQNIIFDGEQFKRDVLNGNFKEKVFEYDFDIKGTLEGVMNGQREYTGSVDSLIKELLECDHKRANIQPYEERQLTDINKGHWELFEDSEIDAVKVNFLVARPPQLDVRQNGICAIDFGTKSTIVVCRDGEARMLRIGQGDYSKVPTMKDFENPTVIELRDLQNFLKAYRVRSGRPFTEWNQFTVSH